MNPGPKQLRRLKNPYRDNVQGKANEPHTVVALLEAAKQEFRFALDDITQDEVVRRLDKGNPRIAIIGGSADHPAHVEDRSTTLFAVGALWKRGAIPFAFSVPVLCDGTAQSNLGMCYSLQSRNLVAEMVINQMEAHSYHGAIVLQGCDKTPFAICSGLAYLDRLRRRRGEAPVHATFVPAHVLRGGTFPRELRHDLRKLSRKCRDCGHAEIADDIERVTEHILQCTSNQAFQGVLIRARRHGLLTAKEHKDLELRIAANTCHPQGGICAFNGTGNSCRIAMSAFGLVHPAVEFLTDPPTASQIDTTVDAFMKLIDRDEASVANLVVDGFSNAVRVHSATGGSTNLILHMLATRTYAGMRTHLDDYESIRLGEHVPDLFDYSLTEDRHIFSLAQQVVRGESMGVATVLYELNRLGIPVDLDAMTVDCTSWAKRIGKGRKASASKVKENPIILDRPRKPLGGIDQLHGNFFSSAVVKISGMPDEQIDAFDEIVAIVWYFQNEDEATECLLQADPIEELTSCRNLSTQDLRVIGSVNRQAEEDDAKASKRTLLHRMAEHGSLRIAVVIAGQGPRAFGMPEMFTPMQHVNSSVVLKRYAMIISDGRYSGVTYGAAVGHVCPEAFDHGPIMALQTGDLLWIRLRERRIDLLEKNSFRNGKRHPEKPNWHRKPPRRRLLDRRHKELLERRGAIAVVNQMDDIKDASYGVVPDRIWEIAE